MKRLLLAGAAVALLTGMNLSPAMAQTNPPARWDTTQAMSQAMPQPVDQQPADTLMPAPRYESQYHYGGSPRHPRWEPQQVPVR
jgi:hypothetical protein